MTDECKVRILGILLGDMMITVVNGYPVGIENLMERDNSVGEEKLPRYGRSTLLGINIDSAEDEQLLGGKQLRWGRIVK